MRQVEGGSLGFVSALDTHQKRHGSIQKVMQWCRNDGQVDVLPLEREQQSGDALCHHHQTVVV